MDQRRNRRGTFHGIGQPDIKRKLRRLAASPDKQQQRGNREHRIPDREVSTAHQRVDVSEAERARYQESASAPRMNPASPVRFTMKALFAAGEAGWRWK